MELLKWITLECWRCGQIWLCRRPTESRSSDRGPNLCTNSSVKCWTNSSSPSSTCRKSKCLHLRKPCPQTDRCLWILWRLFRSCGSSCAFLLVSCFGRDWARIGGQRGNGDAKCIGFYIFRIFPSPFRITLFSC